MAGYTDAIVLEAPVFWWPSLGQITQYPIDAQQTFLSTIADAEMPWPRHVLADSSTDAAHVPTVGLSRLGRSVWLTASWSPLQDGDAQPFVQVWCPTTAAVMHLPVCTCAGLGSTVGSSWDGFLQLSPLQLAREGRIRLTHRAVPAKLCSLSAFTAVAADQRMKRVQLRARQDLAYPLLHRVVTQVHGAAFRYLRRVAQAALHLPRGAADVCPLACTSAAASGNSFLFVGDTASHHHLLRVLRLTTPPLVPIPLSPQGSGALVAFEARRLNFAEVLTLNEHEALETVEVVLRPPPLCSSPRTSSNPSQAPRLLPCLLLTLEGLHLLDAQANSLVAGVTHQLCLCLEALQQHNVPVLIWSFAEDTTAMSVALRSRVGAQQVRLSTTTLQERATYLKGRLSALQRHVAPSHTTTAPTSTFGAATREDNVTTAAPATVVIAALAEETAHWSIDRLVRLGNAELLLRCADVHTPPPTSASAALSPPAVGLPAEGAARETLHAVYSHLYGIADDIRKVEELVVWPLTHLGLLRELSIPCSKGVLICGPSGAGKTALLRSLVRRLQLPDTRGIHVLSVDGLSLIEKEVGRSEKNIARLFDAARSLAPTALFIDNLDALAPPRGRTTAETNTTGDRTLSTLLTQMDGVSGQADRVVVVVASAPSRHTLDPAVCRPGRLDVHVHLRPPPLAASAAFMKTRLRQFVAHVRSRGGAAETCDDAASFVDAAVDDYFAKASTTDAPEVARAAKDEGEDVSTQDVAAAAMTAATMSPAEVSAVVREVMLYVAERLGPDSISQGGSDPEKAAGVTSHLQQYVVDAFARLHTAK